MNWIYSHATIVVFASVLSRRMTLYVTTRTSTPQRRVKVSHIFVWQNVLTQVVSYSNVSKNSKTAAKNLKLHNTYHHVTYTVESS